MIINSTSVIDTVDLDEDTSAERVGNRIRMIRIANNFSQPDLGAMIGLNGDRVQKYENGARKPKLDLLKKFALALNVDPLALTDPILTTEIGTMYALFEMERLHGLRLTRIDNRLALVFERGRHGDMNDYLFKWEKELKKVNASLETATSEEERAEILKEYHFWEWRFPKDICEQTEKRLNELRKNELKEQIKQLQNELSELEDNE